MKDDEEGKGKSEKRKGFWRRRGGILPPSTFLLFDTPGRIRTIIYRLGGDCSIL